jgi:murein L,D-transpeptidase YafK
VNRRPLVRALLASVAIAAAMALAGCDTDGTPTAVSGRHMQPISDKLLADLEAKGMTKEAPILVRIFKEEAELEVWKEDKTGRFSLLHTYPICRWSGDLGPKIKQGDRQAPEGFYPITPGQMNPNSNYFLAINTGFPNAYDRANGRSGDFLMIHGDCSSRGCYAMTDEQIGEIYALAREAFFGGQKAFQIQAYPFHMTPQNLARHRNSPHMAFWKMIKQGYDAFEVSHLEPKVDVCEKRYVFNAESSGRFSAAEHCPPYRLQEDIMSAVRDKQQRDDAQIAELSTRIAAAPAAMSVDGGMNPAFLAAVKSRGGPGAEIKTAMGTIPAHVNPPAEPETTTGSFGSFLSLASSESKPAPAPASTPAKSSVQVASAGSSSGIGGFFGNLFGSKSDSQAAPDAKASPPPSASAPKSKPAAKAAPTAVAAAPARKGPELASASTRTASAIAPRPQPAPSAQDAEPAEKPTTTVMSGAAPTVPSGGFENRFGAWH